jgi:hypothetical protein
VERGGKIMPATFAHCLMVQTAIDKMPNKVKQEPEIKYVKIIGEKNNFVIMGATGPDYPYLTDILTTEILQIGHNWSNRMHYESTLLFVKEGIKSLSHMDKSTESFAIRLSWFCGFVSHIMADSYVHPVINSIVGGIYLFTHTEHARCELIQDVHIFKNLTGEDIVSSNPREGSFGYLNILEECSDPADAEKKRVHPEIRDFWRELLKASHPNAEVYFESIDPDKWHENYTGKVDFVADPRAIFRHLLNSVDRAYMKDSDIIPADRKKYIEEVTLPDGATSSYDVVFNNAVNIISDTWLQLFKDIEVGKLDGVDKYIKDWNLDTGVDESKIVLWLKKEV